jgi:hypothetical protein
LVKQAINYFVNNNAYLSISATQKFNNYIFQILEVDIRGEREFDGVFINVLRVMTLQRGRRERGRRRGWCAMDQFFT